MIVHCSLAGNHSIICHMSLVPYCNISLFTNLKKNLNSPIWKNLNLPIWKNHNSPIFSSKLLWKSGTNDWVLAWMELNLLLLFVLGFGGSGGLNPVFHSVVPHVKFPVVVSNSLRAMVLNRKLNLYIWLTWFPCNEFQKMSQNSQEFQPHQLLLETKTGSRTRKKSTRH